MSPVSLSEKPRSSGRGVRHTVGEIEAMLAPRGFEFWNMPSSSPCRVLNIGPLSDGIDDESAFKRAGELMSGAFGHLVPNDFDFSNFIKTDSDNELNVAIRDGDKVIGIYLLSEKSPVEVLIGEGVEEEDAIRISQPMIDEFAGKRGVEGAGLVVSPDYRDCGFGHLLRAMPGEMGYDYAHGLQLKTLNNIEDWKKFRHMVLDAGESWYSAGYVQPIRPMAIALDSTATVAEYESMFPKM